MAISAPFLLAVRFAEEIILQDWRIIFLTGGYHVNSLQWVSSAQRPGWPGRWGWWAPTGPGNSFAARRSTWGWSRATGEGGGWRWSRTTGGAGESWVTTWAFVASRKLHFGRPVKVGHRWGEKSAGFLSSVSLLLIWRGSTVGCFIISTFSTKRIVHTLTCPFGAYINQIQKLFSLWVSLGGWTT